MNISALRADGLDLPFNGLKQAFDELARTPNPVDSVNLSPEAVTSSRKHMEYSLDLKTEKIRDEIAQLAINIIG